jgi:hypothetical protein
MSKVGTAGATVSTLRLGPCLLPVREAGGGNGASVHFEVTPVRNQNENNSTAEHVGS